MLDGIDRPILEYYEAACVFHKLNWHDKFIIGFELNLVNDDDYDLDVNELDEVIFVGAIRNNLFTKFKDELTHRLVVKSML